mgnify:CR=1 FL=1
MISPRINGAYKEMTDGKVKAGGAWKQSLLVYTKVNGAWEVVWGKDILDLNVFYSTTASYHLVEEKYDNLPHYVAFVGLEITVYGSNNTVLTRVTEGTEEEPALIGSASYNLYNDTETLGEFAILVNRDAGQIEYSFYRTSSNAKRIEVKIEKILIP